MNRKISFLAAGLMIAATMTGCTKTAAPYVTPYNRLPRTAAAGDYHTGTAYRGSTAGLNTHRTPQARTGLADTDARWNGNQGFNPGVPYGAGVVTDNYPAPGAMYR